MEKYEDRVLFLKEFVKELIVNSTPAPKEMPEEATIINPVEKQEVMIARQSDFNPPLLPSIGISAVQPGQDLQAIKQEVQASIMPVPVMQKLTMEIEEPKPIQSNPQMQRFQPRQPFFQPLPGTNPLEQQYLPQPQRMPVNFNLGKINFLVADPRVTSVECQGPGKLVITRIFGKPAATKISLSQEEITEIVDRFSREAKIPIISGLFKAAVGNLIITAVISELVGSRFIITKISPAFSIQQINQQAPIPFF